MEKNIETKRTDADILQCKKDLQRLGIGEPKKSTDKADASPTKIPRFEDIMGGKNSRKAGKHETSSVEILAMQMAKAEAKITHAPPTEPIKPDISITIPGPVAARPENKEAVPVRSVPRFDLADQIMNNQRQVAANRRRKNPQASAVKKHDYAAEGLVGAVVQGSKRSANIIKPAQSKPAQRRQIIDISESKTISPKFMEMQSQVVSAIVAMDIARYCGQSNVDFEQFCLINN